MDNGTILPKGYRARKYPSYTTADLKEKVVDYQLGIKKHEWSPAPSAETIAAIVEEINARMAEGDKVFRIRA